MGPYLILLYQDETTQGALGEDEQRALLDAHDRFAAAHGGALRGGGWLAPTATATTLRGPGTPPDFAAGADAEVVDGPFVETKEALAGYYLVEATDLDGALALAREVPAPYGGVEVRPLMSTG
jgi:hypothetical protein